MINDQVYTDELIDEVNEIFGIKSIVKTDTMQQFCPLNNTICYEEKCAWFCKWPYNDTHECAMKVISSSLFNIMVDNYNFHRSTEE